MIPEETAEGQGSALHAPSQALSAPDPAAAILNAATLWAEQNTRPETLDRADKLKDKVSAVTSFFDSAGKHPGEVTPEDVAGWRDEMVGRGLRPAPSTPASRDCRPSTAG